MYIYTYIYICIHICKYVTINVYSLIYTYMYICKYLYIRKNTYICIYFLYINISIYHIYIYIYTYISRLIYVYFKCGLYENRIYCEYIYINLFIYTTYIITYCKQHYTHANISMHAIQYIHNHIVRISIFYVWVFYKYSKYTYDYIITIHIQNHFSRYVSLTPRLRWPLPAC